MIPKELFHYTSSKTALKKILLNQEIKIGQVKYTNDPRESKDWSLLPKFTATAISSSSINEFLVNQGFTKIKQEEWKVICFGIHAPKYRSHPMSNVEEGFLHGACRPRMWATYAENHKGVCLRFNGKEFNKQIKKDGVEKGRKVFHGKVKYIDYGDALDSVSIDYTELSRIGITQGLQNHLIKYHKEFFLLKSTDWKTEYEYRWLVHSRNRIPELLPISGLIEDVIVGVDFQEDNLPKLYELCDKLEIPVKKISWRNGYPSIFKLHP